jgi:hypothetical protein
MHRASGSKKKMPPALVWFNSDAGGAGARKRERDRSGNDPRRSMRGGVAPIAASSLATQNRRFPVVGFEQQ